MLLTTCIIYICVRISSYPFSVRSFLSASATDRDNRGYILWIWTPHMVWMRRCIIIHAFFFYSLPTCKVQKLRITLLRVKNKCSCFIHQDNPVFLFFVLDSDISIIYSNSASYHGNIPFGLAWTSEMWVLLWCGKFGPVPGKEKTWHEVTILVSSLRTKYGTWWLLRRHVQKL